MHWRYSAIQARFFGIDATAGLPLLLTIIHLRQWTFYLALACVIVLFLFERRGMTPLASLLYARARLAQWIGGGRRPVGHPLEFTWRRIYVK